jgi:hypothetical protein
VAHEVWGTFSVDDHTRGRAFVNDVLLYDRLVLPVPPKDEPAEWDRWTSQGWDPERQRDLREILRQADLVREVEWNQRRRAEWRSRHDASSGAASEVGWAMAGTRTELTQGLPRYVRAVESVTAYSSVEEVERELGVQIGGHATAMPAGTLCAAIGWEFLAPRDPGPQRSDADQLRAAVEIAADRDFRRRRADLMRWEREFIADSVTDREAIRAALTELTELVHEQRSAAKATRREMRVRYGFRLSPIPVGLTGALLIAPPVGIAFAAGGAFLALGSAAVDWRYSRNEPEKPSPAAFVHSVHRHFGWDRRASARGRGRARARRSSVAPPGPSRRD